MGFPITFIARGKVRLAIGVDGGNLVRIEGTLSDEDSASWLNLVLAQVHEMTLEASLDEVVVDLRRVEHASAALWKCLLGWLRRVRESPEIQYRLRLRLRQGSWQETGAAALAGVGAEQLVVEAE
jgi:hypothetical protein